MVSVSLAVLTVVMIWIGDNTFVCTWCIVVVSDGLLVRFKKIASFANNFMEMGLSYDYFSMKILPHNIPENRQSLPLFCVKMRRNLRRKEG